MKPPKEWKFYLLLLLFGITITLLSFLMASSLRISSQIEIRKMEMPKFVRADDWTPCYIRGDFFQCDFVRRNKETDDGEDNYAVEVNPTSEEDHINSQEEEDKNETRSNNQ